MTFTHANHQPRGASLALGLGLLFFTIKSFAAGFPLLPEEGNIVGRIQYVVAENSDTLLDIARRFDLGYNEIIAANTDIDPWLPKAGARVVVPTRFILPSPPWRGIIINLAEMRLYYFPELPDSRQKWVDTYPLGIGRDGWTTPLGEYQVQSKIPNPNWTMPDSIVSEALNEGRTPMRSIPPGPDNPMGEFALMLDASGVFIHGTNKPYGIGRKVSHGCIRLYPEDIRQLFENVPRNTPVRIVNEPYKLGYEKNKLYLESHAAGKVRVTATDLVQQVVAFTQEKFNPQQWDQIMAVVRDNSGVPTEVATLIQPVNSTVTAKDVELLATQPKAKN